MKNLFFLLFLPIFVFSQTTERQQKEQVRSYGTYGTQPTQSYTPSQPIIQQKYSARDQNNRDFTQNSRNPSVLFNPWYNNHIGTYRWNPVFGWNSFSPYYWYDNWGWRNPGRIYVYDNGRTDTIRRTPIHGIVGLHFNTRDELGAWATLGKNVYLIVDYTRKNGRGIGVYYPLLTLDKVLPWSDRKLDDEITTNSFSVGLGKKLDKRMGVHMTVGVLNEEKRFRFYDDMFILSNNGEYTFPNYKKNITILKIGTIIDVSRNFVVKLDCDLTRGVIFYGVGLKF